MDKPLQMPALNEFSVGQLGADALRQLLILVEEESGSRLKVIERVRERWFAESASARVDPEARRSQQDKRAGNVISGMRQAGLLDSSPDPLQLSELARELLGLSDEKAFDRFSEFLLKERHGYELLQFAADVRARDGAVSKRAIDDELRIRGYRVPTNSSYSGKVRGWLELSGVVDANWVIDDTKLTSLLGVASADISEWLSLSTVQRDFLEILRRRDSGNKTPVMSSEMLELARQYGVAFDPAQVKKSVYGPLAASGWIQHLVKAGGRGGKGGTIELTEKGRDFDSAFAGRLDLGAIPAELQNSLSRALADILAELDSEDSHVKGVALELLALRIASELGLTPVELRQRGVATGGAEVDLVAEGVHLHFSRWLFQCKNQKSAVGLQVLAKELGMALLLKAQVVVIVTTSIFAKTAHDYARIAGENTSVQVVLLDRSSLTKYRNGGAAALRAEFHGYATDSVVRKREQLLTVPRQ